MIIVRNPRFAADLPEHDGASTLDELRALPYFGRLLICYQTGVIIPPDILEVTAAYNFHGGPPEYPGRDPHHWAIYDGAREFGVTCHRMSAKVDAGDILFVRRFPIEGMTVWQVRKRAEALLLGLFWVALPSLLDGTAEPCGETWGPVTYRRRDMLDLCRIGPDVPPEEVARRRNAFPANVSA
jgi:methionyl-tRNA formyltransferase